MVTALTDDAAGAVPIAVVSKRSDPDWRAVLQEAEQQWLASIGFEEKPDQTALVPGPDGRLGRVVHGADPAEPVWALGSLPDRLPDGVYRLDTTPTGMDGEDAASRMALGWALGAYAFTRYKTRERPFARLVWPAAADHALVSALADGMALTRDLINTPAEDMGPEEIEIAARAPAERHGGAVSAIIGDELLLRNYPSIHAVGRASVRAPQLVDLTWGDPASPRLTLVGKGVSFDSGGLDIKTAAGMRLMKKDMGGAATLLGLAHAIMATGLRVRLRVLIPAVENAISANAFRPMDVIRTRKGTTVEIGNTDAEGRLVLADALTEAVSEKPALIIDMATLTGAARVALGPDLPALFSNDDATAQAVLDAGTAEGDPLWRLPLWKPYRKYLDSSVADINNASESGFAGSITAALYLDSFVEPGIPWIHIDTYAWNPATRPGRPEGGEALALRALYRMVRERFE